MLRRGQGRPHPGRSVQSVVGGGGRTSTTLDSASYLHIGYFEACSSVIVVKFILLNYEYILIMNFINRTQELTFLQRKYDSDKAEFIILYGRRRVCIHQSVRTREG